MPPIPVLQQEHTLWKALRIQPNANLVLIVQKKGERLRTIARLVLRLIIVQRVQWNLYPVKHQRSVPPRQAIQPSVPKDTFVPTCRKVSNFLMQCCCSHHNIEPTPCEAGFYCPSGSSYPLQCLQGTYCGPMSSAPTPCPLGYRGRDTALDGLYTTLEGVRFILCVERTPILIGI